MKAHAWVGTIPLGRGSQAVTLCKLILPDVVPIPLDTSEAVVGEKLTLPEWICAKCRKVEIPKCSERQFVYAVRNSKDGQ